MRIRKPRYLSTADICVATVLGVIGGIYIWKPIFIQYQEPKQDKKLDIATKE